MAHKMTLRLSDSARHEIEKWVEENCSNFQVEINRSIIERARRERLEREREIAR